MNDDFGSLIIQPVKDQLSALTGVLLFPLGLQATPAMPGVQVFVPDLERFIVISLIKLLGQVRIAAKGFNLPGYRGLIVVIQLPRRGGGPGPRQVNQFFLASSPLSPLAAVATTARARLG